MRIIGQEQIADVFGVAPKTIVEWQGDGFPVALRGGPGVPSEYETETCIGWLVSREVGKVHAALARAVARGNGAWKKPCVILSGGEATVTVRKQPEGSEARPGRGEGSESRPGRGGRAGEFCMGLTQALQGQAGVWALAADTDGIDGIEDNAGAFVAPDTLAQAQALGMKVDTYLDRNDAYGYFSALGDLVVTGPTHTNVNDFRVLLIL